MPEKSESRSRSTEKFFAQVRDSIPRLLTRDLGDLTPREARLAYILRLLRETWREIKRDQCLLRATALAYQTLLGLIPLLVIVMSLLASPSFAEPRQRFLDAVVDFIYPVKNVPENGAAAGGTGLEDIRQRKKQFRDAVENLAGAATQIGVVGLVFLIVIFVWTMRTIEESFNAILGAHESRPLMAQVARYSAILLWGPLLVLLSFTFTQYMHTTSSDGMTWLWSWLFNYVFPFFVTFVAFLSMYLWLPNSRVRLRPGLVGAAVGTLLFEICKHMFSFYAANVISYSSTMTGKVYGTLSVLPVMLLWFYVSWVVILFGVEVAFVVQNFQDLTTKDERIARASRWRSFYAVRAIQEIGERFFGGQKPLTVQQLADRFSLPEYEMLDIMGRLQKEGLVEKADRERGEVVFLPARDLETLSVGEIVAAIAGETLESPDGLNQDPDATRVGEIFNAAREAVQTKLRSSVRSLTPIAQKPRPASEKESDPSDADAAESSAAPQKPAADERGKN